MNSIAARMLLGGRVARMDAMACTQMQAFRGVFSADKSHDKKEPAASPWVKVLERPGDEAGNRSEEPPVVPRPDSMKPKRHTGDASEDVPEKNPDSMPQARTDPQAEAMNEANKSQDSMRYMADKLNQAVGGEPDFPKTGGASVREMASEIGGNIKDKVKRQ
eukprot:GHUV01026948.1.p1 GENE.GHUV01026948.1~~GHUV01026948.1.p1  ORF type:complete len:162 (-),score=53.05 GHUV01026948.1:8-493(-)